jgi:putative glutamine amidotransferase
MKPRRIGITQRLDPVPGRDEQRDALDQRWPPLLWRLGLLAVPLGSGHADPAAYLAALALDGYLLSGGNDIGSAPGRDRLETAVLDHAAANRLPVFGVCRGLQFINHYQGGTCAPVAAHVATRHAITGPLAGVRTLGAVNSFHGNAVLESGLGRDLEPLAYGPDGSIEALRHVNLPWLAIMWHPERELPAEHADLSLIQAHFEGTR